MKRILFVDDESLVLQGLKRMLRSKVNIWDMVFVESGQQALEALGKAPFDVIVTDMRMPQMDGAMLLEKVSKAFPYVVRIVLSGHAELESTLRVVPIAHQFLTKPCDIKFLENTIERSCNLQKLLEHKQVRSIIHQMKALPSQPKLYNQLTQALTNQQSSLKEISQIIEQDLAMSAKTLHLVNSAYFGLSQRITSIHNAVSYLGTNMIKILALSIEVFRCFASTKKIQYFSLEEEQSHAFLTACIAKQMFKEKQKSEDAFMAGLLHDIGKLVLAEQLPDNLNEALCISHATQTPFEKVERSLYQVSHAEIGAYLLGIWGLPYSIVEAVAHHHNPQSIQQNEFDILAATYVANILAQQVSRQINQTQSFDYNAVDYNYLTALGVDQQLHQWQTLARTSAEQTLQSFKM